MEEAGEDNDTIPENNTYQIYEDPELETLDDDGECEDEDDDEDDYVSDEDDSENEKWVDVRVLEKMSLEEVRQMGMMEGVSEEDKRLDPPVTKVIVRRLPPQITVEGYLQEITEIPKYNYIRLVPSNDDLPSRIGKRSSIYINFESEQEAFWFKEKYNKMTFFDERGNSYIACVDFSFFQDVVPAAETVDDEEVDTLEESEIFQTFLKSYDENPFAFTMIRPDTTPTPEVMLEEILNKKVEDPDSTPLLQFLREKTEKKEAARKERDVRRKEKDALRRDLKERDKKEKRDKESRRKERDRERRLRKEKERSGEKKLEKESRDSKQDDSKHENEKSKARERDSQKGKQSDSKDPKSKNSSGTITYSKSGNPTRWSENSGPRKNRKEKESGNGSQKKPLEKSSTSVDEDATTSLKGTQSCSTESKICKDRKNVETTCSKSDETKSAFGKPFPVKEQQNTSDKNKSALDDPGTTKREKISETGTKKKIVKKVTKVRKVTSESANVDNVTIKSSESTETKKKIIRVVKKGSKTDIGNSKSVIITKKDTVEKDEGVSSTHTETKVEADKERKPKKGRPEIQIYRPGSLRGTNKPAGDSSVSGSQSKKEKSKDSEKEDKSH